MKFLVDENFSRNKKFLEKHKNFENIIDKIGKEVPNKEIIKYAKEHDYGVYTQSIRCAMQGLIEGIIVWYRNQETKRSFKLEAHNLPFTEEELKEGL